MQKRLSVRMLRECMGIDSLSATTIATSSALLMVCLSVSDCTAILMVRTPGKTTPAPMVGWPFTTDPSVYTKSSLSHIVMWGLMSSGGCGRGSGASGSWCTSVYFLLQEICVPSGLWVEGSEAGIGVL